MALVCVLVLPAAAGAQSNRPDPDSPAGVEYELPLDQTREDLSGDGGGDGRGSRDGGTSGGEDSDAAPLFGAGITSGGGGSAGGADGSDRGKSTGTRGGDGGSEAGGKGAAVKPAGPTIAEARTATDSGGTGLLIPGIALAVLLAGGLIGLALRRGLGQAGES